MTAMPWGRKNSTRASTHSSRVAGPAAATTGTMLRLVTATTKSRTRSHLPSTRWSWGPELFCMGWHAIKRLQCGGVSWPYSECLLVNMKPQIERVLEGE